MLVLIADSLSSFVSAQLEQTVCAVKVDPSLKGETLTSALRELNPDVLVVRSTKVFAHDFQAASRLSLIVRAGAGTNNIDVVEASKNGIYVANCPGRNALAVAELAMGHLLNLDRRIADNVSALRRGEWKKKEFGKAKGLAGRTIAVLGVGNIGEAFARRALAFGMTVRGWDLLLTPERASKMGIQYAETALDACRGADAVSIHLPATDLTRKLVGRELFLALNPGAYVINTSRGEVIDSLALENAIKTRGLRAGLDVFEKEPASTDKTFPFPIKNNLNVYGTHHIGASTLQASESVGSAVVEIVTNYLKSGNVINCINLAKKTPASHMLSIRHANCVGVLAGVLEALRENKINVQSMKNSIFSGAKAGSARIQLDSAPSKAFFKKLDAMDEIFAHTLVSL